MHPELFTIPGLGVTVKTYGFFLAVGFLSCVWLAMRRASRVKADPDRLLDASFFALLFGVAGARLFFVIHYWADFAAQKNKLLAIVDIRNGGLEFLGGLIGGAVAILIYMRIKNLSARLYFDIIAPSCMWALAIGRLGCFFNGCCFGGLCITGDPQVAKFPWAVQFPYGSNAHIRQWEDRLVTVPAELIDARGLASGLVPAKALNATVEQREGPKREVERLEKALAAVSDTDADKSATKELQEQLARAKEKWTAVRKDFHLDQLAYAQQFPSREDPARGFSVTELQELAASAPSLPVHPTQLYSTIHALILSGLLSVVFYVRKRHGVVIGLLFVLYPIGRVLLEIIRTDNPHDVGGLTISQFVSASMFAGGLLFLFINYRFLPMRSLRAVPVPSDDAKPGS